MGDKDKNQIVAPIIGLNIGSVLGQAVANALANQIAKQPEQLNNGQLKKLREEKIKIIRDTWTAENLVWKNVSLVPSVKIGPISFPVVIQVSEVVKIDGYYIPVNAKETFEFAEKFKALPLTRRVAHQLFQNGSPVAVVGQYDASKTSESDAAYNPMFDFVKQSKYLESKNYGGVFDFGAHKIWALSIHKFKKCMETSNPRYGELYRTACENTDPNRIATNYGFYINNKPEQDLGARHEENHWDYSQLLQLMRGFLPIPMRNESGNLTWVDLNSALIERHPAIWDE